MTTSYKDLVKQREALENQIKDARQRETSDAVSRVRTIIEEYELTAEDVFPPASRTRAASSAKGGKVAAKYRDPATGATWTGRGKAPRWIQNEDRARFAIAAD